MTNESRQRLIADGPERGSLLRVRRLLRELARQTDLKLDGQSYRQVAEQLGLKRITIIRRQRLLRKLAAKAQNWR